MNGVAPIHASLLPSGKVLMAGVDHRGSGYPVFVMDPAGPGPVRIEPMRVPMRRPSHSLFCAGHAYLADGRMLQVGGGDSSDAGLRYALLFNEDGSPQWTPIDDDLLGGLSWYPTVTRMADGTMLVISGFTDFGTSENRTVQLFRPASFDSGGRPWKLLVPHEQAPDILATGSDYTHTFVLPKPIELDGHTREVVMIGKTGRVHFFDHTDDFEDPPARFATRPNGFRKGSGGPVSAAGASSAMLADGRILIVGGGEEDGSGASSLAHIYDPYSDSWRTIELGIARSHPAAVLLPDTSVVIVNGNGAPGDPRRPQIIDPSSGALTKGPPWPDGDYRGYHNVALLLPDGRVLTGGGERFGEETERADLRYFLPPYLSGTAPEDRPAITSAPQLITYGGTHVVEVERGPIHKVTLLALGSMTHSFDANQRCVELFDGEALEDGVSFTGPPDPNVAPPGDYMLFVLRRNDVGTLIPSFARMVRVG